jgi:hypothetical protein
LVGMITVQPPLTMIGKRLKPLDVRMSFHDKFEFMVKYNFLNTVYFA